MHKLSHSTAKPRTIVRIPLYPRLLGAGLAITLAASCDRGSSDLSPDSETPPAPLGEGRNEPVGENAGVQDSGGEERELAPRVMSEAERLKQQLIDELLAPHIKGGIPESFDEQRNKRPGRPKDPNCQVGDPMCGY